MSHPSRVRGLKPIPEGCTQMGYVVAPRRGGGDPDHVIIGDNPSSRSKQFLYGLIANQEGIPFYGATEDGNKNDKTWDKELLEKHQLRID